AGSLTPPSQPTSPPSIFAAAVAGYSVPTVERLNSTAGATMAVVATVKIAIRRSVTGRPTAKRGTRKRDSGLARTPSVRRAARAGAGGRCEMGAVREERRGHQQGGQRDLHAGERAPDDRPHPHEGRRREERRVGRGPPGEHGPSGQEAGAQGGDDPERLRRPERGGEYDGTGAEQQSPQWRRRARDRVARIE